MTAKDVLADTNVTPWSWLKSMSRELYQLDQTPLLGYSPQFPWEQFSQDLTTVLGLSDCKVYAGELTWREKDDISKGFSAEHFWTEIAATGLEGSCFVVVNKADIQALMKEVLNVPFEAIEWQKDEFVQAFYRFLGVEALHLINSLDFEKRLSFRIISHEHEAQEPMLTQDVHIMVGKEKLLFRICLSSSFQQAWRSFYQGPQKTLPPTKDRLEQALVPLHVEAGRTGILLNELLQIKPGDFVFLDRPFYIPDSDQSHVIVSVHNKPLFRAQEKDGTLTVLEIPLHHEVYDSMVDKIDKINQPLPPSGFNPAEKKPPQMPPIEDEENPFEDEDDDEEEEFDIEEAPQAAPKQAPAAVKPAPKAPPTAQAGPLKALSADDIPLTLVVEVGQVSLSAQKLMELQPGNTINLEISPVAGVDLVINGRIIGKGELLKIGESIGVRIIQIGT